MSADNFWYVKGGEVYCGFASDFNEYMERAEERFKAKLLQSSHPFFAGTHAEAIKWANDEYAEYGVYWVDEDNE